MPVSSGTERERIAVLESEVKGLKEKCEKMVTKEQFDNVKIAVYGAIGLILSSVIVTLLGQVLRTAPK